MYPLEQTSNLQPKEYQVKIYQILLKFLFVLFKYNNKHFKHTQNPLSCLSWLKIRQDTISFTEMYFFFQVRQRAQPSDTQVAHLLSDPAAQFQNTWSGSLRPQQYVSTVDHNAEEPQVVILTTIT